MRVAAVLLILLLGGCQAERDPNGVYTTSGHYLGSRQYHEITQAESRVIFDGPADRIKKREVIGLYDRYNEKITFYNNAILTYQRLFNGGFAEETTDEQDVISDLKFDFYKKLSINPQDAIIKRMGYYTYALDASPSHICFVFRASFGQSADARGIRGNEQAFGNICYPVSSKTSAALEAEMTSLLGKVRFDDGTYNKAHPNPPAETTL